MQASKRLFVQNDEGKSGKSTITQFVSVGNRQSKKLIPAVVTLFFFVIIQPSQ